MSLNPESHEYEPRPPIRSWFMLLGPLGGKIPRSVRRQMLGAPLPLRYDRIPEGYEEQVGTEIENIKLEKTIADGVVVEMQDVIDVLHILGRDIAASWWEDWAINRYGAITPSVGLIFDAGPGILLPPQVASLRVPAIEDFH